MTFSNFTTQEFIAHPQFRKWVLEHDEAAARFWADWLRDHPGQEKTVLEAKEVLLALAADTHMPPPAAETATWERVMNTIAEKEKGTGAVIRKMAPAPRKNTLRRWLPYAAVLGGLIVVAAVYLLGGSNDHKVYQTAMGELKTVELPDHSVVKLNVNSSIRYADNWDDAATREIWLEGEAFFTVTHNSHAQPFVVHTNDVDVKVLGTEFNVNTRRVKTQVVLSNGAVQLVPNDKKVSAINMKPGDMVVYSAATAELINKKVDPENFTCWQSNILKFNEAPIAEVIRALQDNMGITVVPEDGGFNGQTFTGSIPMDNIEIFFKTLSRSFDVEIEQTGTKSYRIYKK